MSPGIGICGKEENNNLKHCIFDFTKVVLKEVQKSDYEV
jgi:hypothetical protein